MNDLPLVPWNPLERESFRKTRGKIGSVVGKAQVFYFFFSSSFLDGGRWKNWTSGKKTESRFSLLDFSFSFTLEDLRFLL